MAIWVSEASRTGWAVGGALTRRLARHIDGLRATLLRVVGDPLCGGLAEDAPTVLHSDGRQQMHGDACLARGARRGHESTIGGGRTVDGRADGPSRDPHVRSHGEARRHCHVDSCISFEWVAMGRLARLHTHARIATDRRRQRRIGRDQSDHDKLVGRAVVEECGRGEFCRASGEGDGKS